MNQNIEKNDKYNILNNPAIKKREDALNEEWSNFMTRVGEVSTLVKDMASGDRNKADAAKILADHLLEGKVIKDDNIEMKVKENRTVINKAAFKEVEKDGQMDKNAFMAEVEKDAAQRSNDRKIRKEKADTLNTIAIKAFRRGDYEKALSYYNKALDQVKDNPMYYCDRALTHIKLGKFEKVFQDCDWALRLNENSFKARLYKAKAHKELEELDKLAECRTELHQTFPQHDDLIKFFLDKKPGLYDDEDENDD